jgi:hypothetical protein
MSTYVAYPTAEQETLLLAFLEKHNIPFYKEDETLPDHVLDGIKRGQGDIEAGRFITLEEFKKRPLSAKR